MQTCNFAELVRREQGLAHKERPPKTHIVVMLINVQFTLLMSKGVPLISMAVTKKIMSSPVHEQKVVVAVEEDANADVSFRTQMLTLLGCTRPHQGPRAFDQRLPTHSATDCVCFRPPLPDCSHEFRRASHISQRVPQGDCPSC